MKKICFLPLCSLMFHAILFAQDTANRIIYFVDSVPIMTDPAPENDIIPNNISDVTVIADKDSLTRLGFRQFNKVIYIFMKAYETGRIV